MADHQALQQRQQEIEGLLNMEKQRLQQEQQRLAFELQEKYRQEAELKIHSEEARIKGELELMKKT